MGDEISVDLLTEEDDYDEYNEIVPRKGDKDVGKVLMGIVNSCIKDQQDHGRYERWAMYEDMGRNIHFTSGSETEGIPLTSCNLLHKNRTKALNSLFANKPTFNAKPAGRMEADQEENLKLVERAAEHWFREQHIIEIFRQKIGFFGETDGTYIGKMTYDPKAEGGVGEVVLSEVNPRHYLVYPTDAANAQDADINIFLKPMTVRAANRQYPAFKGKIKPDSEILNKVNAGDVNSGSVASTDYTYEINDETYTHLGMGESGEDDKKTLLAECWIRDYSGNYTGNIRVVTVCSCGEVVLEDVDNKSVNPKMPKELQPIIYLSDKVPVFTAQSIPDPTTIWGGSDFDQLSQLNKDLDKALTFLNILLEEACGLTQQNPRDSGVSNEELKQAGSKIISPHTAAHGQGIKYNEPPPIPPVIPVSIELLKTLFYELALTFDVNQANAGGKDIISAKALALLQEQQNLSYVGKQMSIEYCLEECGRMYTSLAQSFYVNERFISYTDNGETQQAAINAQALHLPVKMTIVPGSTMPISKIQQREEAIGLYEKRIVTLGYVLQKLDIDGWRDILAEIKEGPRGEFLKKLSAMLPVPPETMQAIAEIMKMDPKEFDRALKAGQIGKIQLPQAGQGESAEKGKTLEQHKLAISNAKMMVDNDKTRAEIAKINKDIEKANAEIQKIMADAAKTSVEKGVALEGANRDKESLEIERAKFVKELTTPKPEKMGDKNTAGFRESGMSSNNRE